ncbi:MAG: GNAT family N-acetyltransferase [Nocardioidaceae bacterium]
MSLLAVLASDQALARADDLTAIYAAAFGAPGYDEDEAAVRRFREDSLPRHAERDGFRCAVAEDAESVVGFAYGYTGERGQWWSDHVAEHAPQGVVEEWLGGHFEFVELAVQPAAQGGGIGAALAERLVRGLPHDRALLTTYRDDRPAPRLYRRLGWRLLATAVTPDGDLYGLDLRGTRR